MPHSLTIYIASAGSGKTHNLTLRYLALALTKDFSSIQAVTFTNKATEEMKERIVRELYHIAAEPLEAGGERHSVFFDELCSRLALSDVDLRDRARQTLRYMLLNYGRFRVKTIDSFFQEVLRSFARELNLSGGFRLELQADLALEEAVVSMLADQDERQQEQRTVQQWIATLAKELIINGKGHNLKQEILKLARELKKEPVKQLSLAGKFPDRESLASFKQYLAAQDEELSAVFINLGCRALDLLDQAGLSIEDLSRGKSGGLAPLYKLSRCKRSLRTLLIKNFDSFPKYFENLVAVPTSLFAKDKAKKKGFSIDGKVAELQQLGLWGLLDEYQSLVPKAFPVLSSIYKVQDLLNSYGLIAEVDKKLKEQQRSVNTLLLSDAPSLIHAILSDASGVQFIYEKLGTRLEHQMIDEFQDTSELQYQNFRPLLQESMASGHENLIVGDLKQSIYRFRNSNSNLLATQVKADFSDQYTTQYLSQNWRSTPQIIDFNNYLFGAIPAQLTDRYAKWIGELSEHNAVLRTDEALERAHSFVRYYEGAEQEVPVPRRGKRGVVAVHHYTKEDKGDKLPPNLPEVVVDLQRRGYRPSDIAILVRTKREAILVAEAMQAYARTPEMQESSYSLEVISSEALRIDASTSVRCLIAALEYIVRPSSKQYECLLREAYKQMCADDGRSLDSADLERIRSIGRLSLYEVVEGLFALWREEVEAGELPYQVKLLDIALKFQSDLSADVSDFLEMWHREGKKETLTVPDDDSKVRLMTVHKSKGLGFSVVLLPSVNWELTGKSANDNILWCDNPLGMQECIERLPVPFSSSLEKTLFVNEFFDEAVRVGLDALNLFYVAMTRAKDELHFWISHKPPKETTGRETGKPQEDKISPLSITIQDLILPTLEQYRSAERAHKGLCWIEEGDELAIDLHTSCSLGQGTDALPISELHVYSVGDRIEVLREGMEHFDRNSPRIYGRLMHSILSGIHTADDVPLALLKAEHSGLFVGEDRAGYERELIDWIERVQYSWFSPKVRVLRELPIIGGGLKTSRRPDRIVLYPDGAVDIVDYKFGKKSGAYIRQVREYQRLVRQMGYAEVRGYIWYVLQGEVVSVP